MSIMRASQIHSSYLGYSSKNSAVGFQECSGSKGLSDFTGLLAWVYIYEWCHLLAPFQHTWLSSPKLDGVLPAKGIVTSSTRPVGQILPSRT